MITLQWKRRTPPSLSDLYARIKDIEVIESMVAWLADKVDYHNEIWGPWHLRIDPT